MSSKRPLDALQSTSQREPKRRKINEQNRETELCSHCGGVIPMEGDRITDEEKIFHRDCKEKHLSKCKEAVCILKDGNPNVTKVLFMAIDVHFLYGLMKDPNETKHETKREKKRMRDIKAKELLMNVSALRNSGSGHLIIQLVGLAPADPFTGAFDEFADDKLNALIEDGAIFGNVYLKSKFVNMVSDPNGFNGAESKLDDFSNCLVLYVGASSVVTTSDFATKVPLDFSIIDPSPFSMIKFMKEQKLLLLRAANHTLSDQNLSEIQESRDTQLKGTEFINVGSTFDLGEHIWEKLKLPEYICAFSKNKSGGKYFLGIGEKPKVYPGYIYKSQVNDVHGLSREQCEVIQQSIQEKVKSRLLICDFEGQEISEEIINFKIKPTDTNEKFVLVVSVHPVEGLVFNGRHGPLAYKVKVGDGDSEDQIVRIPLSEWFKSIVNS